jgi:hypothetical protein
LEHVRWAYALVKRDVEQKLRLVVSNDGTYDKGSQLIAKITKIIDKDHGETIGVIRNRLRSHKPEDVEAALKIMESNKIAEKQVSTHKSNCKTIERWFFTG